MEEPKRYTCGVHGDRCTWNPAEPHRFVLKIDPELYRLAEDLLEMLDLD